VVRAVSPDSFRNPNADRQGKLGRPQASEDFGTLYYRTKISLDTIKLHNLPPGFRMAPGMPVTADIKIGERTVMRYLLQRMIPATTEGMREP
jgi:HlyD family secretion protein